MHLLLNLVLAHLFADFPLQTNALARLKRRHLIGVIMHASIYTCITALMIADWVDYWPLVAALGIAHFLIDATKPYLSKQIEESLAFVLDQCLHMATMIGAAVAAQWLWTPAPVGVVPAQWLPYTLWAASIPAIIVAYWIWATGNGHQYRLRYQWLEHFYRQALIIEQRIGLAVIGLTFWLLVRSGS